MAKKFLQDSQGNSSSKRLWGSIVLSVGLIFACILFAYSILEGARDPSTASGIINMFLIAGSSLLGIGVFEKGIGRKDDY